MSSYICQVCGQLFSTRRGLKMHVWIHQTPNYECGNCLGKSVSQAAMQWHIRTKQCMRYRAELVSKDQKFFGSKEGARQLSLECDRSARASAGLDDVGFNKSSTPMSSTSIVIPCPTDHVLSNQRVVVSLNVHLCLCVIIKFEFIFHSRIFRSMRKLDMLPCKNVGVSHRTALVLAIADSPPFHAKSSCIENRIEWLFLIANM